MTYVEVNGTSRPVQSVSVELSLKQRGFANVVLVDVGSTYTVSEGQQIEIGDGVGVVFGGTIDEATAQWIHPSTTRFWSLRCVSYEQITSRRFVGQRVYARQPAGDVIRDIVTTCLFSEGVNVDDVLDGPDVGPLQFDFETVEEAFDIVAAAAGMYWDIIYNRHLRFFERTTYAAPWAITATAPQVRRMDGIIALLTDRQMLANRIYVQLGQYLGATETETYPGDGSSTLFQLLKPIGAEPTIRVNGVDKTVGIQGVETGKDWYWQVGSQTVEQDSGGTVLTSSDDLEVVYVPLESKVLLGAQDSAAISARATLEGLSGIYDHMIDLGTPTTQQQAEDIAAAYLAQHKNPARAISFPTVERDLDVGMAINVTLPAVGIASATAFLIESVRFTDGVGQKPLTTCTCSTGALLPTWQQVLAGTGSGSQTASSGQMPVEGGGSPADPLPDDVAIGTTTLEYYIGAAAERRVIVTIPYTAPTANFNGFNGVAVFSVTPPYDDPTPLDPTGEPPIDRGWSPYSGVAGGAGQAQVDMLAPDRAEGWIFTLAAGRDQVLKAQPWPGSGTISVGPATATNVTAFDIGVPSYATARIALVIPFSFTLPAGASYDVLDWDRVEIHVRTASMSGGDAPAVAAVFDRGSGAPGAAVTSRMEFSDLPTAIGTWTFTAVSFRLNGDRHSGSPTDTATIDPPPNAPATAPVTSFSASVVTSTNEAGIQRFRFEGSWANPTGAEFVGVEVTAVYATDPTRVHMLAVEKEGATTFRTDDWPMPDASQSVTVRAQAINVDGIRSAIATVALTITPQATGTLKANRLASATLGAGLQNTGSVLEVPVAGISSTLIADLAITTGKLGTGAVSTAKLAALAVDAAALANSAVTSTKIANAAVGSAAIANAAIGNAHIANLAVSTGQIQDLAVTNAKIANLSVDNAKISSIAADKITAGTITASVLMTSPSIDINTGSVRVQIDSSNKMKVSAIPAGSYTTLNGDWVEVGFTSGSSVVTMSPATFGVTSFGSLKARIGQVSSRGLLELYNTGGGLSVDLSAGNYAKFSDPVTCSNYLRVDGQLRIAEFFAHGTGDPFLAATHKAPVYDEFGTFLGYSYLYP